MEWDTTCSITKKSSRYPPRYCVGAQYALTYETLLSETDSTWELCSYLINSHLPFTPVFSSSVNAHMTTPMGWLRISGRQGRGRPSTDGIACFTEVRCECFVITAFDEGHAFFVKSLNGFVYWRTGVSCSGSWMCQTTILFIIVRKWESRAPELVDSRDGNTNDRNHSKRWIGFLHWRDKGQRNDHILSLCLYLLRPPW